MLTPDAWLQRLDLDKRVAAMSLLIMITLLTILLGGIAVVLLAIHRIDVPTL